MHRVGLAAGCLIGLAAIGIGLSAADQAKTTPELGPIQQAVAAGKHLRIEGPRGPIHVWIPAGYRADTGATLVYVHGYFDNVDTAWIGHQIPEQFAMAGLNAMLIAPEAPMQQKIPVNYPNLGELIRIAEDASGTLRGAAFTAVIGHSGAFRTIQAWLDEPTLDHITMVDAMYGEEELIAAWLRASPNRKLITLGEDTLLGTESFASKFPDDTFTIDRVPPAYELWPAQARTAKHLYVRAQFLHMPLVTDAIVVPSLLRLLPVERLGELPWQLPLGTLQPIIDAPPE